MHGRPRKSPKPEDLAASAVKSSKLRQLQSQFLQFHHNKDYSKGALEVSAKLLEVNPEYYTAWNYRKLAVKAKLSEAEATAAADPEFDKSILDEELRVVENALRQNFKSYGAWHHRKWVLSKGRSSIDHELKLLERFQKADSRNFHAWNYRRFVAGLMNRSEKDELKYTTDMINTNFSNYSAWHNRSVLLSNLLKKKVDGYFSKEKVLNEEYELVHQAIFTDPDDQSGWFYYLWLLDQTIKANAPVLLSSWPTHGSSIVLSRDSFEVKADSAFYNTGCDLKALPIILYFNQPVEGVGPSTVSVDTAIISSSDLIWEPIQSIASKSGSKSAQVWVSYLSLYDLDLQFSKPYPIEVSLGHCEGIVSSSGSLYCRNSKFSFTITLHQDGARPTGRKYEEMISWRSENFQICDIHSDGTTAPHFSILSLNEKEPSVSEWQEETTANEIALFRELLSEINCKIGKLTLARLLVAHDALLSPYGNAMVHSKEILELYGELMTLDPPHYRYYKDEQSSILLQQVLSSSKSLLQHCYHYGDESSPSGACNNICLRLNNMSLSRLGSLDKLLGIQMLDLSNNELQSIEGLEALQLLSCLNLSNNKFCSFSALEPLRRLESLKVLDISRNEIGSHSIDTTRYLCSSPLSHSEGFPWNLDAIVPDGVDITNYWEAYLLFKGINLIQLDLLGNAVSDENFQSFLIEILPNLRWLDGKKL